MTTQTARSAFQECMHGLVPVSAENVGNTDR
jgi:hypothetical protein